MKEEEEEKIEMEKKEEEMMANPFSCYTRKSVV